MYKNEILLNYFKKQKLIDAKALAEIKDKVLKTNNADFNVSEFLYEKKYISKNDYINSLSHYYNLPYIDIDFFKVDFDIEKYFSLELMKRHSFLPLAKIDDRELVVAISDPQNVQAKSIISSVTQKKIDYIWVAKEKISSFLTSFGAKKSTTSALENIIDENNDKNETTENTEVLDIQDAPAIKFVDAIIKEAIPLQASDIHIEPRETEVVVRYRIDGDLVKRAEFPIDSYPAVCARIKIISNMDIAERRIPQDGRISLTIDGTEYDFRVSSLPTIHGEKFVIRVFDNKMFSYSRKELNFSDEANELIEKILKHPHGIILLTGPTGCGKTTTLYAFLKELNKENKNLITIEDPVEYSMEGINQIQINNKANLTFASSLRSILRQDPDIIMVGEIRDNETAQIAIRAAITGHLVLSTLHTNNAPGAVMRLIDMGVDSYLVSDSMVAVISQRLVKKLCPNCKQAVQTTKEQMEVLGLSEPHTIYRAKGCPFCHYTGFKGRMAVHEIMYMNEQIRNTLSEKNFDQESLKKVAINSGMTTLAENAKKYVISGVVAYEDLISLILGEDN